MAASSSAVLGVVNALCGSFCSAAGYTAHKYVHNQVREDASRGPVRSHKWYIGGWCLLIGAALSTVVNLNLLGQAAQAPFAALGLMYNAVLAAKINGEAYTLIDAAASLLITCGVTVAICFAPLGSETFSLASLMENFTLPMASQFTFGGVVAVFVLQRLAKSAEALGLSTLVAHKIGLLAYSLTGGLFAGFGGVCVKTVSEMAKVYQGSLTEDPLFLAFAGAIPLCLYVQINEMMKGLKRFNQLQFVPCYQASILLGHLSCGAVYFHEFDGMTPLQSTAFLFGISLVEGGVLLLILKSKEHNIDHKIAKTNNNCTTERTRVGAQAVRVLLSLLPSFWQSDHGLVGLAANNASSSSRLNELEAASGGGGGASAPGSPSQARHRSICSVELNDAESPTFPESRLPLPV